MYHAVQRIVMLVSAVLSKSADFGAELCSSKACDAGSTVLSNLVDCGAVLCSPKACDAGQCCTKQFSGLW